MDFKNDFIGYDFTWFIGEVESRDDPLKLGRVRVRCFGWHPKDKTVLPTADLPWAQTVQPVTAPAASPTGLTIGRWVFGFFVDGDAAQRPMIIGQIPGYRFDDDGIKGESELPRAARAEEGYESPQSELRKNTRITDISLNASAQTTWSEPEEPEDKVYPYVQTVSSETGFVTETISGSTEDGLPQFTARQVTYDSNGGYEERKFPSGDKVVKVMGDNYEIVCGSSFINIKGDVNMTVDGSMRQNISGDYELNVAGNMYTVVGGSDDKYVVKDQVLGIVGTRDTYIGGVSLSGNVGDKKIVALGGSTDTVVAGGRITTTAGAVIDTTVGAVTRNVTGGVLDTVVGTRLIDTQGALTQTATSHIVSLGAGTLFTTGTISTTTLLGTTITGGTVISTVPYPVTLGTHTHIETGGVTLVPKP